MQAAEEERAEDVRRLLKVSTGKSAAVTAAAVPGGGERFSPATRIT